jgi:hypothetical protein
MSSAQVDLTGLDLSPTRHRHFTEHQLSQPLPRVSALHPVLIANDLAKMRIEAAVS